MSGYFVRSAVLYPVTTMFLGSVLVIVGIVAGAIDVPLGVALLGALALLVVLTALTRRSGPPRDH